MIVMVTAMVQMTNVEGTLEQKSINLFACANLCSLLAPDEAKKKLSKFFWNQKVAGVYFIRMYCPRLTKKKALISSSL